MTAPAILVQPVPDGLGFEVIRHGALFGRRAAGFRLNAADANRLASELHEVDRAFSADAPRLVLWGDGDAAP